MSISAVAAEAGAAFPPVVVYRDGDRYWLSEGFHRYAAHAKARTSQMMCEVRDGDRAAALLNAVASNKAHGLKRTNDDKRLAVRLCVTAMPDWTTRQVADHCGVHPDLVSDVQAAIAASQVDVELPVTGNSTSDASTIKKKSECWSGKRGRKSRKATQAQAAAKLHKANPHRTNDDIAAELKCHKDKVKIARKALEEKDAVPKQAKSPKG